MNEAIEKLLAPVSAEQPAGPDLGYDPRQDELETLLKGKAEVEIGNIRHAAEPPDWGELKGKSAELFEQTKSLRVATILCCSMLQTAGIPGFRDGLQLIRGLLENFWSTMYPRLDPEDNNDPTQRLNLLGSLTAPRGSLMTGWMSILDYLFAAPLCRPRGSSAVSYEQLHAARLKASGVEGAPTDAPSLDALGSALRSCSDQVQSTRTALQECIEAGEGIDQFLTNTLGATGTINFDELLKSLREMANSLEPYLSGGGSPEQPAASVSDGEGAAAPAAGATIVVSGSIRSREDVVRALDRICDYYQQVEPSSPVPFLLRRAQKLATMDFVQAVQELNLIADLSALRPSMGSTLDSLEPPPAS
jgi:type VI secretion system protein ImpA